MYMLVIVFVSVGATRVVGVLYVQLMLLIPQTYEAVDDRLIPARRDMGAEYVKNENVCVAFARLASQLDSVDTDIVTVLYSNAFFGDGQLFYLCMPLQNAGGIPVRYTTSLEGDGLGRWGKIQIDYVLTPSSLDDSRYTLIHEEEAYRLYDVSQ